MAETSPESAASGEVAGAGPEFVTRAELEDLERKLLEDFKTALEEAVSKLTVVIREKDHPAQESVLSESLREGTESLPAADSAEANASSL